MIFSPLINYIVICLGHPVDVILAASVFRKDEINQSTASGFFAPALQYCATGLDAAC